MKNLVVKAPRKYPVNKIVYVDVDGTIILDSGEPNEPLIAFLRKLKTDKGGNFEIILWSMAGEKHAREVASKFGITNLFSHILTKPSFMIDNSGKFWLNYTQLVTTDMYRNQDTIKI